MRKKLFKGLLAAITSTGLLASVACADMTDYFNETNYSVHIDVIDPGALQGTPVITSIFHLGIYWVDDLTKVSDYNDISASLGITLTGIDVPYVSNTFFYNAGVTFDYDEGTVIDQYGTDFVTDPGSPFSFYISTDGDLADSTGDYFLDNRMNAGNAVYFDYESTGGVDTYKFTLSEDYAVVVTVHDVAPVPEPTTMLLFGTGIAGLASVARRKRK